MNYKITINDFEGPMDLLLHLVKKDNIDIFNLNIESITEQYLSYIHEAEVLNLDIASEYLVLAAELVEIKSSSLLPKKQVLEDEYEEDPKEKLIERLIEYQKYKELIPNLKNLEEDRKNFYSKAPSSLKNYEEESSINYGDLSMDLLMQAFQKFLERKEDEKPLNTKITKKEYSISVRSKEIKNVLLKRKKVNFEELFEIVTKEYVVVTFLSILTMAKRGELLITQTDNFSNIVLSLKGSD